MLKNLKKARKILEILMARLGLAILPFWPRWMILACARLTGIIAYHCAPGQRRLIMANLEIAFGQKKSRAEKKRIAVRAFQNVALVFLDFFWFARCTRARVRKYVKMDSSVPAYFPPPPAVVVTAHFGNWELMSRAFTAHGYLHIAVFCRALRDGCYMFYALPQFKMNFLPGDAPDFVGQITQQIASTFQQEIEKYPEQWMWMYKRWKHIKPDWPANAYPYYAKPLR